VAHFMENMPKVVGLTVVFSPNFMMAPFAEHILFYFWEKTNTTPFQGNKAASQMQEVK